MNLESFAPLLLLCNLRHAARPKEVHLYLQYHHLGPKTQQMDIKPLVFTKRLGRFGFGYPSNINHTLGHACVCGRNLGSVMFTWIWSLCIQSKKFRSNVWFECVFFYLFIVLMELGKQISPDPGLETITRNVLRHYSCNISVTERFIKYVLGRFLRNTNSFGGREAS